MNLANSLLSRQADGNETLRGYVSIYLIIYSTCWRGLTALSILCDEGNARAYESRMDTRTDTCAFFVYLRNQQQIAIADSGVFVGSINDVNEKKFVLERAGHIDGSHAVCQSRLVRRGPQE